MRSSIVLLVPLFIACGGVKSNGGGGTDAGDADADAAPDAPGATFSVEGVVTDGGLAPPAAGNIIVAWVVTSGSPDTTIKLGEGTADDTSFMVSYNIDELPIEAINVDANGDAAVGVGIVVAFPPDVTLPAEGEAVSDTLLNQAYGAAPDHAIIFQAPADIAPWEPDFDPGFSCGRCVRDPAGGFDSWEPAPCSEVEVKATPDFASLDFCNWT